MVCKKKIQLEMRTMNWRREIILAFGLFVTVASAFAQPGWKWPEQEDEKKIAMEKNAYYNDLLKQKNYEAAVEPLEYLFEKVPDLNKAIYINGEKIYRQMVKKYKKDSLGDTYKQKLMDLYDARITYFGDKPYVLNKKALYAYQYYLKAKDPEVYKWIMNIVDSARILNQVKMNDALVAGYMQLTNILFQYKEYDTTKVLDNYTMLGDLIDEKMATYEKLPESKREKKVQSLTDAQKRVDDLLIKTIDLSCDMLESTLGPKFDADTTNVKLAKKLFKLLLNAKCSDSPYFERTTEVIFNQQPDFGLAKILAISAAKADRKSDAIDYWRKAAGSTDDASKQGEAYINIARLYASFNKPKSKEYALKAVKTDNSLTEAYSIIGNLCMNSFADCKGGVSKVKDRGIFLAAYSWYKKAGDTKGMASAKSQFPSKTEAFEEGYAVDSETSITVGCWINQTVVLKEFRAQ